MPTWNGITYTELIGPQGNDGWQLAFANDANSARRNLGLSIYSPGGGPADPNTWITDVVNAVRGFVGYPQVLPTGLPTRASWNDPPVSYLSRKTPLPFPSIWRLLYGITYPPTDSAFQQPFLYCTQIGPIQGIDWQTKTNNPDGNDISTFGTVKLPCQFEALTYYVLEDNDPNVFTEWTDQYGNGTGISGPDESTCARYVTKLPNPSADYFTVQNGIMKFAEGVAVGTVLPFQVGKILANIDLIFRWEQVPEEAISSQAINPKLDSTRFETQIDHCLGKVNDRTFPSDINGQGGYPAGTLLLLAVKMTPFNSPAGRRLYTVEFGFKFFAPGHHKIYSFKDAANGNTFVEISSDGVQYPIQSNPPTPDGKHIYDVAFFDPMFWPPTVPVIGG